MKSREEMIDLLVDNDIFDWNDNQSRNEWLDTLFRKGFLGYESMSDKQLHDEFLDREFGENEHD